MVERLWCVVCNRGIDGVKGKDCPECISRGRGRDCGILKTPEQAVKDKLEMAQAVKLARKGNEVRGHKSIDEKMEEMKKSLMAEIKAEFDLVPKDNQGSTAKQVNITKK